MGEHQFADRLSRALPDATVEDFGSTGLKADTIAESTAAAGVTIDSVALKDGGITAAAATAISTDIISEVTAAGGVTIDTALIKDGTFQPKSTTLAATAAGIGYSAADGLRLIGQGTTNDVVLQNDLAANVLAIPTGTTWVDFPAYGGALAANALFMGRGTSASPATTATAGKDFIEFRCSTTATSGDNRLLYMRYAMEGAGASGESLRTFTKVSAALNTARGAHISLDIDDAPAGSVTGLGVGVDAQLLVPDAAVPAGGTYFAGQSQIYMNGASSDLSAVTTYAIHSFQAAGNATGVATVLNAMAFQGSTGTGKMIYNITGAAPANTNGSIRILVDEGSGYVARYLMYYDAQAA